MVESISVSTTPTHRAYLSFMFWSAFRQIWFLIPIGLLLVVAYLFAPLFPMPRENVANHYRAMSSLLYLPGIIFVFLPIATYLSGRRRWKASEEVRDKRLYTFSDTGIEVVAKTFQGKVEWSHIKTVYEWKGQIFLGTAQRHHYLVPTNDFNSTEQANAFRQLVRAKVVNCKI